MKRESLYLLLIWILTGLALGACNVPEKLPTPTPTPDHTATPVPPTATPTLTPTATNTPLPEYLDVSEDQLSGVELALGFREDGKVRDKLRELAAAFNEENEDGITIRILPASSMEELAGMLRPDAMESADMVIANSDWLRAENAEGIVFAGLSEFMDSDELSLEAEGYEAIMPEMLRLEERDGSYQALPLWTEPSFLFYNKTWALELGFENTPEDLASFAEQACAAGKANYADKEDRKHGTGGWIVNADANSVMSWLLAFSRDEQSVEDILQEESGDTFIDAASWLRNLFDNACAWTSRVREPYDYFANRYALFYSGTYSDAERQFNAFRNSDANGFDNWDLIFYPRQSSESMDPRVFAETSSIAMKPGDPEVMNAGWRFIRWLYGEGRAAELALAAGGWPVQDSDAITRIYRNSGEDKLYQTLSYRQYITAGDAGPDRVTDQKIVADGFGYVFNPSAKADDIPGIWEQIGSVIAEISAVSRQQEAAPDGETESGVMNEEQP